MQNPNDLVHGQDGWELERYSWDKVTGKARFTYTKGGARAIVFREQPHYAGGGPIDLDEVPTN